MEKINKLRQILACPNCQKNLLSKGKYFFCEKCGAEYNVNDDIVNLLPSNFQLKKDYFFKMSQIDFFDRWCSIKKEKKSTSLSKERFFSPEVGHKKIKYSEEEMTKLISLLPKDSWVLELGCGAGEHSEFIAKIRNDINLVMIDISLKSVLETKKRLQESKRKGNFYFLVADAENLPFRENTFSGIIAVMFFHHLSSLEKCFECIRQTLRLGGVCLVIDLLSDNPLMILSRKIFHLFPSKIKQRFIGDYVLENGNAPEVEIHRLKEFKDVIFKENLKIIKEEPYDLFLHIFIDLGIAFPSLKILMTEKVLDFLYNIERKMLKNRFISNFAGTRTLWLSH